MPVYTIQDHIEGIQYGHIAVRQTEAQFNGVWRDMTFEKIYNRDAKTKSFTGINQHPAAMEKYWRDLPVLTAESEQTKTMTMGVFYWASSVTYVLTDWTFLTIFYSTGTGNEAM